MSQLFAHSNQCTLLADRYLQGMFVPNIYSRGSNDGYATLVTLEEETQNSRPGRIPGES